jgi:hypothetical protein
VEHWHNFYTSSGILIVWYHFTQKVFWWQFNVASNNEMCSGLQVGVPKISAPLQLQWEFLDTFLYKPPDGHDKGNRSFLCLWSAQNGNKRWKLTFCSCTWHLPSSFFNTMQTILVHAASMCPYCVMEILLGGAVKHTLYIHIHTCYGSISVS